MCAMRPAPSAPRVGFDSATLADWTVAFVVAEESDEDETLGLWDAVALAGGRPALICPESGEAWLFKGLDRDSRVRGDQRLADAVPTDYDALVLPGGAVGVALLSSDADAVRFMYGFFLAGKPVVASGHAARLLVTAGLVYDRMLTSHPSLSADIADAGGLWHDHPVVICRNGRGVLITGRGQPGDLQYLCAAMIEQFGRIPV